MTLRETIKWALENTVLCRGGNGPKESYEYAEKMERVIKGAISDELKKALDSPDPKKTIQEIIDNLYK